MLLSLSLQVWTGQPLEWQQFEGHRETLQGWGPSNPQPMDSPFGTRIVSEYTDTPFKATLTSFIKETKRFSNNLAHNFGYISI